MVFAEPAPNTPMNQQEKAFTGLSGEFLVAGELNRRRVAASITYGASKRADIFAFSEKNRTASKIEVKTTRHLRWPVGNRALKDENRQKGIFWVLVQLPDSDKSPRYFIFTGEEIQTLTYKTHGAYLKKYFKKHGKRFDESKGIPALRLDEVIKYENR